MAWYRTGTVSVTAASTTVTGSGTAFVANARVGDAFIGPDGRLYEISNVASDTAISILPAYIGSTASGQGYAIAPVQGYVKKLADEASELLNEYGAVGTAAFEDAVTSASDTTAGRLLKVGALLAQLGADVYGRGNILGTVSQAAGIPTGAVIQRGSNANGEFVRFADGTQICTHTVSFSDINLIFSADTPNFRRSVDVNWTFPAVFSSAPEFNGFTFNTNVCWVMGGSVTPTTSVSSATFRVVRGAEHLGLVSVKVKAIGRWF